MRVDPSFDGAAPPLTQSRVRIALRGGRMLEREARGARGYPERPATDQDLAAKFLACAARVMAEPTAVRALELLRGIDALTDVRTLTEGVTPSARDHASRS
jgi:2-methylcitrate dehydratase PrpD